MWVLGTYLSSVCHHDVPSSLTGAHPEVLPSCRDQEERLRCPPPRGSTQSARPHLPLTGACYRDSSSSALVSSGAVRGAAVGTTAIRPSRTATPQSSSQVTSSQVHVDAGYAFRVVHCKKVMVTLTNTYGYLSCIFALSTPGTKQVYIKCAECVGYPLSNGCSNG